MDALNTQVQILAAVAAMLGQAVVSAASTKKCPYAGMGSIMTIESQIFIFWPKPCRVWSI